jgi:hypothetical protein
MKQRQGSILETLRRVQEFLDANNIILGNINQGDARTRIDEAVTQLTSAVVDQEAGKVNARGETAKQRTLRLALRLNHMRPIAAVAKAYLGDVPELTKLRMPSDNLSSVALVAWARSMADAASMHTPVMVSAGLKPDFAEQLLGAAKEVEDSHAIRVASVVRSVGGTGAISAQEKRGVKSLRVIDALVTPAIAHNAVLMSQWRSVKKITKKHGPVIGSEQQATSTAATPETPKAA